MKALLFDTGPIISLTTNNLLYLLEKLKNDFKGDFFITEAVKAELIERPLKTKKFKFEALQVQRKVEQGIIKIYKDDKTRVIADQLFKLANNIYSIRGNPLNIIHYTEMEVLAVAIELGSPAIVIDERTTRYLVESPNRLEELLKRKFHTKVKIDKVNLKKFSDLVKGMKVIRSVELVTIAFEKGHLDEYLTALPMARKALIESILWGVKLHGAAVSHMEIDQIVKFEVARKS